MLPADPATLVRNLSTRDSYNTLRGLFSGILKVVLATSLIEEIDNKKVCPIPASPEAVAAYIADCASRLKVGSIQRRLNAIAEAHKAMGIDSPTHHAMVGNTMKGIRRTRGTGASQSGKIVKVFLHGSQIPRRAQIESRRSSWL